MSLAYDPYEGFEDFYLAPPRELADGRTLWVMPMTFGKARLCISDTRSALDFRDVWCYETHAAALLAMATWDGEGEPTGWIRNPPTGRRRPGGDPAKEYVYP